MPGLPPLPPAHAAPPDASEWKKHHAEREALKALVAGLFASDDEDQAVVAAAPAELAAPEEEGLLEDEEATAPEDSFHIPGHTWDSSSAAGSPPPLRPGEKRVRT